MKKIKLIIICLVIFIIFSVFYCVNASSFEFIAAAQREIFEPGEEVIISLDIDNIDAGNEGINVVEMSLEYEESIFDSMTFEKANEWDYNYNNDKSSTKFGKLLYTNISSGVKEAQSIGNIKFKLKDNLPNMETEIKLLSVTSNDGKELMPDGDRIIKIRIISNNPEPIPIPKSGVLKVEYRDTEGNLLRDEEGNLLIEDSETTAIAGTHYNVEPAIIKGYDLVETIGKESGKYIEDETITVTYKYKKIEAPEPEPEEPKVEDGKVTIKYQDLSGNTLKEDKVISGKVGENYKTERLDISKYKLIEIIGNEKGEFTKESKTVIYKYEKLEGKIIVEYIDPEGNIIQKETVITGKIDEPYKVERLEIDGYELIDVIGNEEGVYKIEEQRVSFRYKKKEKSIIPIVPQTGQKRYIYIVIGIVILVSGAVLSYLYINNKKDKSSSNKEK